MINLIIILGLLIIIGGGIFYFQRQSVKTGRNEQKLENAEEAIDNVKKANSVKFDDTDDDRLREKYGRK